MTFDEWMQFGRDAGWIAAGCCATHTLLPMTAEEEQEFEDGGDPCVPAVRVWTEMIE